MRRLFLFSSIAMIMLLIVAACSDDGDSDTEDSGASTTVTEESTAEVTETATEEVTVEATEEQTEEPTEEATEEVVEEATETPAATTTPDATGTVPSTEDTDDDDAGIIGGFDDEELASALITLEDLPEGFVIEEEGSGNNGGFDTTEAFENPCGVEAPDFDVSSVSDAQRMFMRDDMFGSFVTHSIAEFESSEDAEQAVSYMAEMFACEEWAEEDEFGDVINFDVNLIQLDDIADEAIEIQLGLNFDMEDMNLDELEDSDVEGMEGIEGMDMFMALFENISLDMVVFRDGEHLSMVMVFDFMNSPELNAQELAQIAATRISDL